MHAHYERFLPLADWWPYLRSGLNSALPHPDWIPQVVSGANEWRSVIDFWRLVPAQWQYCLAWDSTEEWWALACALAAPGRFGTERGRYPEQVTRLRDRAGQLEGLVLDVGCGTGQGTWEVAEILGPASLVAGVTAEPLEAWMASKRQLPHLSIDWGRNASDPTSHPVFWAADARSLRTLQPAELILCNGLAGGPALHCEADLNRLWLALAGCCTVDGEIWMANTFHDGFRDANDRFERMRPDGWRCRRIGETRVFRRG
jgi:hypothetical protein